MKKVYVKTGNETIVLIKQHEPMDFNNALEAQRFVLVSKVNAMRKYVYNRDFGLQCDVLENVITDIDTKLGYL